MDASETYDTKLASERMAVPPERTIELGLGGNVSISQMALTLVPKKKLG